MKEQKPFQLLSNILLGEEKEAIKDLEKKIGEVYKEVSERERLEQHVGPIVQEKLDYLQMNFPELLGDQVAETIKYKIESAKDEMAEALYPIIGQMIKKYIRKEFELLSERVDKRMEQAFSWKGWISRIKSWFGAGSENDIILSGVIEPDIEQIFVVEQESGILIGSYAKHETMDQDMIAGMLTAIKTFVKEAFEEGNQELESIEYERFKIIIRNFRSFYIAVVSSGVVNAEYKNKLDDLILNFAHNVTTKLSESSSPYPENYLSENLEETFENFSNDQ